MKNPIKAKKKKITISFLSQTFEMVMRQAGFLFKDKHLKLKYHF